MAVLTDEEYRQKYSTDPESQARINYANAVGVDPDEEARVQEMAKAMGVSTGIARNNYEAIKKAKDFDQIRQSPALSRFFSNPDNARLGHDNVDGLKKVSDAVDETEKDKERRKRLENMTFADTIVNLGRSFAGGAFSGFGALATRGYAEEIARSQFGQQIEMRSFDNDEAEGPIDPEALAILRTPATKLKEISDEYIDAPEEVRGEWQNQIASGLGQFAGQMTAAALGSVFGMSGWSLLFAQGAGSMGEQIEEHTKRLVEEGRAPEGGTAGEHAAFVLGTLTTFLTEKFGLEFIASKTSGRIVKALQKSQRATRLAESRVSRLLLEGGINALGEGTQEVSEDLGQALAMKLFYDSSVQMPTMDDLVQTFWVSAAVGGIAGYGMNLRALARTRQDKRNVDTIVNAVREGDKIPEAAMSNLLGSAKTDGTDTIYMEEKPLKTYFQKKGMDYEEGLKRYNIKKGEQGGYLQMPIESLPQLVKSDVFTQMRDHMKMDPNALTPSEERIVRATQAQSEKEIKELLQNLPQEALDKYEQERQRAIRAIQNDLLGPLSERYNDSTANTQTIPLATWFGTLFYRNALSRAAEEGRILTPRDISRQILGAWWTNRLTVNPNVLESVLTTPRNSSPAEDAMIDSLRNNERSTDSEIFGKTLAEKIREMGGLNMNHPSLKGHKADEFPPNLLRKKGGLALDEIGMMPEFRGFNVGDTHTQDSGNRIMEALMAELRGEPVYDSGSLNEALLTRRQNQEWLEERLADAGIDLNEVSSNAEVRRLLDVYEQREYQKMLSNRYDQRGFTVESLPTQEERAEAKRQYDDVVKQYKDTEQWLKAPNGEKSNLPEYYWVLVRTENFKNWFGDWENDPKNASKVLDKNGEPQIVYHGTPISRSQQAYDEVELAKDWTVRRQRMPFTTFRGGNYGGLIFFTPDYDVARDVANERSLQIPDDAQGNEQWTEEGYVFDAFVNARNPFDVSNKDAVEAVLAKLPDEVGKYNFYTGDETKISKEEARKILSSDNSWMAAEHPDFLNTIKEMGYDGLSALDRGDKYIAAMAPRQIKSASENVGAFSASPNILYQFFGEKGAKNIDLERQSIELQTALNTARDMEESGKDPLDIKRLTGWEKGGDGKWRYEEQEGSLFVFETGKYSEKELKEKLDSLNKKLDELAGDPLQSAVIEREIRRIETIQKNKKAWEKKGRVMGRLDALLDDETLFAAYPRLREIPVVLKRDPPNSLAGGETTVASLGTISVVRNIECHAPDLKELRKTFFHELQHAIQVEEGFARGGVPKEFNDIKASPSEIKEDFQKYSNLRQSKISKKRYLLNAEKRAAKIKGDTKKVAELQKKEDALVASKEWKDYQDEVAELEEYLVFRYGENMAYRAMIGPDVNWKTFAEQHNKVTEEGFSQEAYFRYKQLVGEVEARNVSARLDLSMIERMQTLASSTEDVAREFQKVLKYGQARNHALYQQQTQQSENARRLDAAYFRALEEGNMKAAQRIVDRVAQQNGYMTQSDFRSSHKAPNSHDDLSVNLPNLKKKTLVPKSFWTHPHHYVMREQLPEFHYINSLINRGAKTVTVYRAVTKDVKESKLRNGDWISLSRDYAVQHGKAVLNGNYRIIKEEVPTEYVWWDGNDISEFGYDDGKKYAYKNTKNNRKLMDAVVRDNQGNIVPPSRRFNARRSETFFQTGLPEGINPDDPETQGAFYAGGPGNYNIYLFRTADFSTFAHESSHFMLEIIRNLARSSDASPYIREEYERICKYLGVGEDGVILPEQHEKFARSFEAYLMEGKAPSEELRTVFRRFKQWLTNIYHELRNLGVPLSKDIREVFDRMLATDREIEIAKGTSKDLNIITTPEQLGGNKTLFDTCVRLGRDALEAAKEHLLTDAMKYELRKRTKTYKEELKHIKKELKEQWDNMPAVKARREMCDPKSGIHFDYDQLVAFLGSKSYVHKLPKVGRHPMYTKNGNGMDMDLIAKRYGFESGEALIKAINELPNEKAWIEAESDRLMKERFKDILVSDDLADLAQEALHNKDRHRLQAMELQILRYFKRIAEAAINDNKQEEKRLKKELKEKAIGLWQAEAQQLQERFAERAKETINNTLVRKIRTDLYLNTWHKWMREVAAAMGKQDYDTAMEAKRNELNFSLIYAEGMAAKKKIEQKQRLFKRILRGEEKKVAANRTMPEVFRARYILAAHGLTEQSPDYWMERMRTASKNGEQVDLTEEPRVYWRDMTYEEFINMADEVEGLWENAYMNKRVEIDGKRIEVATAAGEVSSELKAFSGDKPNETPSSSLTSNVISDMTRVEQTFTMIGGVHGALMKYIFQPIKDACDRARLKEKEINKRLENAITKLNFYQGEIEAPELAGPDGKPHVFGKNDISGGAELFGMILHMGNPSNLRKLILGYGWGTMDANGKLNLTRFNAFLNRMVQEGKLTKEHFDAAQEVWDTYNDLKPEAQKANRAIYGTQFKEVQYEGFESPFGWYRGGYVPAKTDDLQVNNAIKQELAYLSDIDNKAFNMMAMQQPGFTKERNESYTEPLDLNPRTIVAATARIINYAYIAPTFHDVRKVLSNKQVIDAFNYYKQDFIKDVVVPWLQRSRLQTATYDLEQASGRRWAKIRARAGAMLMFGKLINSIQQGADLLVGASEVRVSNLMAAITDHDKDAIMDKSIFMRDRMGESQRAMLDNINAVLIDATPLQKADRWFLTHAYFAQQLVDDRASVILWTAAYNDAIQDGHAELEAIRHADSIVRKIMMSQNPEDVSNVEAGSSFKRVFTQFSGFFMTRTNVIFSELGKIAHEAGAQGNDSAGTKAMKILANQKMKAAILLLTKLIVPAFVDTALALALKGSLPGDDDWMHDMFVGSAGYVSGLGGPYANLAGDVVINFGDLATGGRPNTYNTRVVSSAAFSIIEEMVKTAYSMARSGITPEKILTFGGDMTLILPVPVAPKQAVNMVKYVAGVANDDIEPTSPVDFFRGAVTGYPSEESKKRKRR